MKEMIKMVVVLTILSVISGGSLAFFHDFTTANIENNQLKYIKGPAVEDILKGAGNDPIKDRFKLTIDGVDRNFFVGVIDGKPKAVAFESSGKGFGGDVGIMVGVDLDTNKILGVGVTTHSETPGMGSRAKSDPTFVSQFKGMNLEQEFKVKSDGGQVDALTGATITSRAVSFGVTEAGKLYKEIKPQISDKAKSFK
jgi:electron transport complex protein RnfG